MSSAEEEPEPLYLQLQKSREKAQEEFEQQIRDSSLSTGRPLRDDEIKYLEEMRDKEILESKREKAQEDRDKAEFIRAVEKLKRPLPSQLKSDEKLIPRRKRLNVKKKQSNPPPL